MCAAKATKEGKNSNDLLIRLLSDSSSLRLHSNEEYALISCHGEKDISATFFSFRLLASRTSHEEISVYFSAGNKPRSNKRLKIRRPDFR